jgi:hypothetical protein
MSQDIEKIDHILLKYLLIRVCLMTKSTFQFLMYTYVYKKLKKYEITCIKNDF